MKLHTTKVRKSSNTNPLAKVCSKWDMTLDVSMGLVMCYQAAFSKQFGVLWDGMTESLHSIWTKLHKLPNKNNEHFQEVNWTIQEAKLNRTKSVPFDSARIDVRNIMLFTLDTDSQGYMAMESMMITLNPAKYSRVSTKPGESWWPMWYYLESIGLMNLAATRYSFSF